jgi:actin-like ATPase involved in cell morphogenesis
MRVLAVDFGTSNTAAALGVDGAAPRLVAVDGSPLVPSSVFLGDDGVLAVGRDADRQARLDPSRFEPNPKRRIDEGELLLGLTPVPVVGAVAAVLRRVAGEVVRQLGGPADVVRLTHPARWGWRRRETLVSASRESGLSESPMLVPEPVAAATHFAVLSGHELTDGSALAVYDLGGGTFDVAVVARRGGGFEVLAEAGLADLGGLDFDHAIGEHIGHTHAAAADAQAWQALRTPTDPPSRRAARALATDIRDGKEALSRHPHVDIALPPPFADMHLTRTELEDLIRPNLQRSVDLLAATIAESGFTADRLAGIYLVGGSSRIPLIARLIQQTLGVTPSTLDQPETSVATGAVYLPAPVANTTNSQPAAGSPYPPGLAAPANLGLAARANPGLAAPANPGPAAPANLSPYPPSPRAAPGRPAPAPAPPPSGRPVSPLAVGRAGRPPRPPGPARPVANPVQPPVQPPGPVVPRVGLPSGATPIRLGPPRPPAAGPPPGPAMTGPPAGHPSAPPPLPPPITPPGGVQPLGPPHRVRGHGRLILIGAAAATALVVTVVSILAVANGGGHRAGVGSTKYDDAFPSTKLRNYVRPFYGDITSCQQGTIGSLVSVRCNFTSDVQATVFEIPDTISVDQLRSQAEKDLLTDPEKADWAHGQVWTGDNDAGPALYWDDADKRIAGLGVLPGGKAHALSAWWQDSFGHG